MITPYEIETKEFSRSMRGFNTDEVDDFLDAIILDLQKLLTENENLKAEVKKLEDELAQYKRSESSVMNTLESAKKLMNDISESAEKRAEIIIRNAKMDAEAMQRDARESISKLTEEGEKLKYKVSRFRDRYRQLLEDQLSEIEGSSEELFADLEREFTPASMEQFVETAEKKDSDSFVKTWSTPAAFEEKEKKAGSQAQDQSAGLKDTIAVSQRELADMLMEDFGAAGRADKTLIKDDLSKTRIVR